MVQSTLNYHKTNTRRIVKPTRKGDTVYYSPDNEVMMESRDGFGGYELDCPYGKLGDLLWVRETWCEMDGEFFFKASVKHPETLVWKPSIFMPKAAARIWLEVKNLRVELVQNISTEDITSEGIDVPSMGTHQIEQAYRANVLHNEWENLWVKINGRESWDANPWVWVVEFERVLDYASTTLSKN